ncbi:MAG: hypothetical protein KGZ25_08480, partial [Planctomycetes bacterium]|nr:hypothetical protein [Planctomycetota bacterium]
MNIVDNLLCHVDRIVDMLNVPGLIGCAYCFLRWPRCVRGKGRSFAILFVVPIAYFLVVSGMSLSGGTAISERYYQPVFPLLIVVSATGLYQLLKDTREWPFMGLFVVIVVIIG